MQRQNTTLHDKKRMQVDLCRGKSWKVVKSRCNKKLCYATTKHDFTRQDMHIGKLMSWKVVKSRCNKKLCYATTEHDFARQETYAGRLMSWKAVKSRCNKKTMLCNDKARLYTTRFVCRQTYVVKSREK